MHLNFRSEIFTASQVFSSDVKLLSLQQQFFYVYIAILHTSFFQNVGILQNSRILKNAVR